MHFRVDPWLKKTVFLRREALRLTHSGRYAPGSPKLLAGYKEFMKLGIDFDNTIACYNSAFHHFAAERGLVPAQPVLAKNQVRDLLRRQGREDEWTELQGHVYGPGMKQVPLFPAWLSACAAC